MKTRKVLLVLATVAALLSMALMVGVAGAEPDHPPARDHHRGFVRWDPRILTVISNTAGAVITKSVTFSTTVDLNDVKLRVTRSLSDEVSFGPIMAGGAAVSGTNLLSNTNYTVDVIITLPEKPGRWHAMGGAITLTSHGRLVPLPLPVMIMGRHGEDD